MEQDKKDTKELLKEDLKEKINKLEQKVNDAVRYLWPWKFKKEAGLHK